MPAKTVRSSDGADKTALDRLLASLMSILILTVLSQVVARCIFTLLLKVDGTSPVVLTNRVGYPRPDHSTAIGKVLLAYLPEPQLRAFLETAELRHFTPKTITAVSLLEQELVRVRGQGYAIDDEENRQGVRCLAAPVWNFTGQVVAAIGMTGPVWSVTLDRVAALIAIVNEAAFALSKKLGYPGGEGAQAPAPKPVGLGFGEKAQPIAMQEFLG